MSLNYAAVGVTAPRMVKGETPLGDATFLAMSELPLFVTRYKISGLADASMCHCRRQSVAAITVMTTGVFGPDHGATVLVPTPTAVTVPDDDTVATAGSLDDHVGVTPSLDPSE